MNDMDVFMSKLLFGSHGCIAENRHWRMLDLRNHVMRNLMEDKSLQEDLQSVISGRLSDILTSECFIDEFEKHFGFLADIPED